MGGKQAILQRRRRPTCSAQNFEDSSSRPVAGFPTKTLEHQNLYSSVPVLITDEQGQKRTHPNEKKNGKKS